jgi:hypothetical protein
VIEGLGVGYGSFELGGTRKRGSGNNLGGQGCLVDALSPAIWRLQL